MIDRYFKAESDALDEEGFFDTGDLAMIDERGQSHDLRPLEGPDQVGRRMDQPGRDRSDRRRASRSVCARRGDRPAGREMGRAPGADRRAAAGPRRSTVRRCSSSLRGKVADWWIPDEIARGRARCRSPRPARSTRTGCAPITRADAIEVRPARVSALSSVAAGTLAGICGEARVRRSSSTRDCPLARRRHITSSLQVVHARHQAAIAASGVAAKCM